MKGNKHNVLKALGDFLSGVSYVDNTTNPASAHSRMMRATEDKRKGPAKGPFYPAKKNDSVGTDPNKPKKRYEDQFRFEDGSVGNKDDYNLPKNGSWSKKK